MLLSLSCFASIGVVGDRYIRHFTAMTLNRKATQPARLAKTSHAVVAMAAMQAPSLMRAMVFLSDPEK
jgi:hypothetical protein